MSLEIYEVRLRIQTLLSRMRSEAASKDLHATKIAHWTCISRWLVSSPSLNLIQSMIR